MAMLKWISLYNGAGERIVATHVPSEHYTQMLTVFEAEYIELPGDHVVVTEREPRGDGYVNQDAGVLYDSRQPEVPSDEHR